MLVEPINRLLKSLLFGILFCLNLRITANGETVLDVGEEVDLPRLLGFDQNLFRLVTLLCREDGINFSSGDGQRARDSGKLLIVDERWVRAVSNVDTILEVADKVLSLG